MAFWIGTVLSVYTFLTPLDLQRRVLSAIDVSLDWRLAIWGFSVVVLLFTASFGAWNEEHEWAEKLNRSDELAAAIRAQTGEMISQRAERRFRDFIRNWVETDKK